MTEEDSGDDLPRQLVFKGDESEEEILELLSELLLP